MRRVLIPPPVRVPLGPAVALVVLVVVGGRPALDPEPAPPEHPAMRLQLAALALLLAPGCREEEPPKPEPGSHVEGEWCEPSPETAEAQLCGEGLVCHGEGTLGNQGYCTPACDDATPCEPVDGWETKCVEDRCLIVCDGPGEPCPDPYDVPLYCAGSKCSADLPGSGASTA